MSLRIVEMEGSLSLALSSVLSHSLNHCYRTSTSFKTCDHNAELPQMERLGKITGFAMTRHERAILAALARAQGCTLSALIRELINEALQQRRIKNQQLSSSLDVSQADHQDK